MPTSKGTVVQVGVFLENQDDIETIRTSLKNLDIKKSDIKKGGLKEALDVFSHKKSPQFLIIDVSKSDMPVSDLNRLANLCDPGVSLLAIGARNDVGLYRDLMKLGIADYLVSPLFPDILDRTLKIFFFGEESNKKPHSKFGKIIAFVGARGGVGTTFLATNFASLVSEEKFRRIALVDLDLHFGTVSLYFDLKQSSGLKEALENPDRMDPLFVDRLLVPVDDRLSIVSAEESLDDPASYKPESALFLLKTLSEQFHYLAVDLPHYSNGISQSVISHAHIMVLVADPSLASLRDAARLIRLFGPEEGGRKIVVVINKSGLYEKGEVSLDNFEKTLEHKVSQVLPFDPKIPMDFVNQGKILVKEKSTLENSIRSLADDILGGKKSEQEIGWFSNLFRKN